MRSLHSIQSDHLLVSSDALSGWQAMIDPNSPYKMLYSLQILNTLVSVNNQVLSDVEVQERYEWRQRFLELGGFRHLYEILISADVSEMIAPTAAPPDHTSKKSRLHAKKHRFKLQKSALAEEAKKM